MKRSITAELMAWKNSKRRKPLVLKGARQVGKTWVLKDFGNSAYENLAYVSLEDIAPGLPSEYAQFFQTGASPERIVQNISFALGVPIRPGSTLVVLDEIQDCPAALKALKRFCEDAPEYHVACAGSLLGVALASGGDSFPVGIVTFLDMAPLTFSEFLQADGEDGLDAYCRSIDSIEPVSDLFAERLTDELRGYYVCGGMPEAVATWTATHSADEVDKVLSDLLDSYDRDFSKHGGSRMYARLSQVWNSLPAQLARENKKFVYGAVKPGARAREFEDAVQWLANAGLLLRVNRTAAPSLPLSANDEHGIFKAYCMDVGMLRRLARLGSDAFVLKEDLFSQFKGAFAENFALQSLRVQLDAEPRYWVNEKPRHEVDFVVQRGNEIVPIEVKAGENVKSASLRYYGRLYKDRTPLRVRLSLRNLSLDGDVLNIPLYLADHAARLVDMCLR